MELFGIWRCDGRRLWLAPAVLLWAVSGWWAPGPAAGRPATAGKVEGQRELSPAPLEARGIQAPGIGVPGIGVPGIGAPELVVPRALSAAVADGSCDEAAYERSGKIALGDGAVVYVSHTRFHLQLCMVGPRGGLGAGRWSILADPEGDRGFGRDGDDLEVSVDRRAAHVSRGEGEGSGWAAEAGGVVAVVGGKGAELVLPLDLVGGYGRSIGLRVAYGDPAGPSAAWPAGSRPEMPSTWGVAVLAPLLEPAATAAAGSTFLDGLGGHVVVPAGAALAAAPPWSLEGWLRQADGECGTLVDWPGTIRLRLCDGVELVSGHGSVRRAPRRLAPGWHHLAVWLDAAGRLGLAVDGELELLSFVPPAPDVRLEGRWREAAEGRLPAARALDGVEDGRSRSGSVPRLSAPEPPIRELPADGAPGLAASAASHGTAPGAGLAPALTLGAARDGGDPLHAYVAEWRLWREVVDAAARFELGPGGDDRAAGLVAHWPLTGRLDEPVGGRHAGRIGAAAPARERVAPTDPPARESPPPHDFGVADPRPPWRGPLVTVAARPSVDGECGLGEYRGAARVDLGPGGDAQARLLLTKRALYLCTGVLYGRPGEKGDGLSLWMAPAGGEKSGGELGLRLRPGGALLALAPAAPGGRPPGGAVLRTAEGSHLTAQEDLRPLTAPWWSGELELPLSAVPWLAAGEATLLGLRYDSVTAGAGAAWPAGFDEDRRESWQEVVTAPRDAAGAAERAGREGGIGVPEGSHAAPVGALRSNLIADQAERRDAGWFTVLRSTDGSWPLAPPSEADFAAACDGKSLSLISDPEAKWPLVDPDNPLVYATGVLDHIWVSPEDAPGIHTSHDVDMKMTLDPEHRYLSLETLVEDPLLAQLKGLLEAGIIDAGQFDEETLERIERSVRTVSGGPGLKLETESAGLPPNAAGAEPARPLPGDRVAMIGRWIFDCGHEPKTEIHPLPMFAHYRDEVRPLWGDGPMRKVRVVRIWMNSDPEPFGYRLRAFQLHVPLPAPGWMPFFKVVSGDPDDFFWSVESGEAMIRVLPPESQGSFHYEVMLGHLRQPDDAESLAARLFTVDFRDLLVHDDEDPGSSGEWYFAAAANRNWRQLLWDESVDSGDLVPLDGVDPVVVTGSELSLLVTAYEQDPLIDAGGEPLTPEPWSSGMDGYAQGSLLGMVGSTRTLEPAGSQWRLRYDVAAGGAVGTVLGPGGRRFWEPRLAGEPNDVEPVDMGLLPVPGRGEAPIETTVASTVVEAGRPFTLTDDGELTLLAADVDRYRFRLPDLAPVEIETSVPVGWTGLSAQLVDVDPWYGADRLPETVRDVDGNELDVAERIGYQGGVVKVSTDTGERHDFPYGLVIRTSHHDLPPDWGERDDDAYFAGGQGGRVVDLATPPPRLGGPPLTVEPATRWFPQRRLLAADWAWQHVSGDVDVYRLEIPALSLAGPAQPPCRYDLPGRLFLRAPATALSVPELDRESPAVLVVGDLESLRPAGGSFFVEVQSDAVGTRRFYRLTAEWEDARHYTPAECDELARQTELVESLLPERREELIKGVIALSRGDLDGPPGPAGPIGPDPLDVDPLGTYRLLDPAGRAELDLVLSAAGAPDLVARLLSSDGVLLAESEPWSGGGDDPLTPDGLAPVARLRASRLAEGELLVLEMVPGGSGAVRTLLGVTQLRDPASP